jgi:hypothetical protein
MLHQIMASEFRREKQGFTQQVQAAAMAVTDAATLKAGRKAQSEREARYQLALKFVQRVEARLRYRRLFDRNGQELFTVHDVVNAVLEDRWQASAHSPKWMEAN